MRFLAVIFGMLVSQTLFAQDPVFTQLYSAPLYLNPSFAGSSACSRVQLNYRNQWSTISAYQTWNLSYDQYVHPIRGGVGFVSIYDNSGKGTIRTYSNSLIYSYKMVIKDKIMISPSVKIGHRYKVLDWDKMTFSDGAQDVPPKQTHSRPDFGAGVLVNTKNLTTGFAIDHLFEPDETYTTPDKVPRKYTAHLTYHFQKPEDSKFVFAPGVVFQQQQNFKHLDILASFKYDWFLWAIAYRYSDAVIWGIGFQTKWIRFTYTYDLIVSKLSNANLVSNEVALRFLFNCKNKKEKIIPVNSISF